MGEGTVGQPDYYFGATENILSYFLRIQIEGATRMGPMSQRKTLGVRQMFKTESYSSIFEEVIRLKVELVLGGGFKSQMLPLRELFVSDSLQIFPTQKMSTSRPGSETKSDSHHDRIPAGSNSNLAPNPKLSKVAGF